MCVCVCVRISTCTYKYAHTHIYAGFKMLGSVGDLQDSSFKGAFEGTVLQGSIMATQCLGCHGFGFKVEGVR